MPKTQNGNLQSCVTRWTARTEAINAILKNYTVLIEVLEETYERRINYGLKAFGFLRSLKNY